jgi:hypothetical protein
MITFKEYLEEARMSPRAYTQTFADLDDDAKIGYEVEIYVPPESLYWVEPEDEEPDTRKIINLEWDDILELFEISRTQRNFMERDFKDWANEQREEWVQDNWETYQTGNKTEEDAKEIALDRAQIMFEWNDWISSFNDYSKMLSFINEYDLKPRFGWNIEDVSVNTSAPIQGDWESGFNNTIKHMAKRLSMDMKETFKVNASNYSTWNITGDSSILDGHGRSSSDGQEGYGVEIISPPLRPSEAIEKLEKLLKILDDNKIETNKSTGIHVNISLSNMREFDVLKLVLFMGDFYVLKKFDRLTNSFTRSQLQQVIRSIGANGTIPKSATKIIETGKEALARTGKYFSVNLSHLPKYLEFRAAGGANYHKQIDSIREITGRWLTALDIACNPEKNKQEYLKKVMKLFNIANGDELDSNTPDSLEELLVVDENEKSLWKKLHDTEAHNSVDETARTMALFMGAASRRLNKLTIRITHKKQMRELMRALGVSVSDVLNQTPEGRKASVEMTFKAFSM